MTGDDSGLPAWWRRNRDLKRRLDLPAYEPPRFSDGVHTHEVVEDLEGAFGCDIAMVGFDTRFGDDWTVVIDGEPAAGIGRERDGNGNTVYAVTAEVFRELVTDALERRG